MSDMESSQRSSVPYTLSDIQLPESPGDLCSKSVKGEESASKTDSSDNKTILKSQNEKIESNGVSEVIKSPHPNDASSESESSKESEDSSEKIQMPKMSIDTKQCDKLDSNAEESEKKSDKNQQSCKISVDSEDHSKDAVSWAPKSPKPQSSEDTKKSNSDIKSMRRDAKHKSEAKHKSRDRYSPETVEKRSKSSESRSRRSDSRNNEQKISELDSKSRRIDLKHKPQSKPKRKNSTESVELQKSAESRRKKSSKSDSSDREERIDLKHKPQSKPKRKNSTESVEELQKSAESRRKKSSKSVSSDSEERIDLKHKPQSKPKRKNSTESVEELQKCAESRRTKSSKSDSSDSEERIDLKHKLQSKPKRKNSTESVEELQKCAESRRKKSSKSDSSDSEDSSDSNNKSQRRDSKHELKSKHKRQTIPSPSQSSSSSSSSDSGSKRKRKKKSIVVTQNKEPIEKDESCQISVKKSAEKSTELKNVDSTAVSAPAPTIAPKKRIKIKRDNIPFETMSSKPELAESASKQSEETASMIVSHSESEQAEKLEINEPKEPPHEVPYVPRKVSLSNRKLSTKSSEDSSTEPKVKKSKWGSFASSKKSSQTISISTDSLKNWFPDFKLINEPTTPMELEPEDHSLPAVEEKQPQPEVLEEVDSGSKPTPQMETVENLELQEPNQEEMSEQGPVSKMIFIQNLVRPFTLNQLKTLLKQNGNFVEESFWIDKIKSKCFVMYESEKEAIKTRNALNQTRWPSSNPKILTVDFSNEEELERQKKGNEPPPKPVVPETVAEPRVSTENRDHSIEEKRKERERRREREKQKPQAPVREWDKDKVMQESPERKAPPKEEKPRSSEKKEKKESKKRPAEDTSAKLLDDLFQKTKGTPCIYWLPLTEEQAQQKEDAKKLRKVEREKRNQQAKEQEESERRSKRARTPRRSREKDSRKSSTRSRSPVTRRR